MKSATERWESEYKTQQLLKNEYCKEKYCDRGDGLFSSTGVCFSSGI